MCLSTELASDVKCSDCRLRPHGFFCSLSSATLRALDAASTIVDCSKGETVFMEGQSADAIFALCQGRVKIQITSSEGKAIIMRIAGPGDLLGLDSTFSGKPYQNSAEALESCKLIRVGRADFLCFVREHPDASVRAAELLIDSYHAACDKIRSLGFMRSPYGRLARFLLDESRKGRRTAQGVRLELPLTHEQIGQIIGMTRETVTRTLSEFRHNKVVSYSGSTLVIQDMPALQSWPF